MAQAAAKGLGKGLSALMSDEYTQSPAPASAEATGSGLTQIPLSKLTAGVFQPRRHFDETVLQELADSIAKNGIMQPIVVRPVAGGKYEIIAGERRFRAAKLAKLKDVPVIVREVSDAQALELALVENIQRADLNPLEEAAGYQRLMDEFGYTQEKLSGIVGKSRSHVANLLRLLKLPESIKNRIDTGDLTMGHARAILAAKDPEELAAKIVEIGMSVRQAEDWAKHGGPTEMSPAGAQPKAKNTSKPAGEEGFGKSDDVLQIEAMLTENLGLKVSINTRGPQAGEVVIGYDSLGQLDEILRRLGGSI